MKAEFFFGFLSFRKNILTLPLKLLKAETKKKLLSIINQLQSGKLWTWVSPEQKTLEFGRETKKGAVVQGWGMFKSICSSHIGNYSRSPREEEWMMKSRGCHTQ